MVKRKQKEHVRLVRTKRGKKSMIINRGVRKRKAKKKMAMHRDTLNYLKDKGGKVFLVGGKVRDDLLLESGKSDVVSKDTDYLVTGIPQNRLAELLAKRGSIASDKNMGVFKFTDALVRQDLPDDVVLPRREKSTGDKHRDFLLEYDENLPVEQDLARRDFTVNAIAKDAITGELIDPYKGKEDLDKGVIRLVNPGAFKEDPLRIMRAGQFASRFDLDPDPVVLEEMKLTAENISNEPAERVAEELRKGFGKGKRPDKMVDLFASTNVLDVVVPEFSDVRGMKQNKYHAFDVDKHTKEVVKNVSKLTKDREEEDRFAFGMAALLHDLGKAKAMSDSPVKGRQFLQHEVYSKDLADNIMNRLKLSNEEKKKIGFLVENHGVLTPEMSDKKIRRLIAKHGEDKIRDLVLFREADLLGKGVGEPKDIREEIRSFEKKVSDNAPLIPGVNKMAITPNDLIKKGMHGKEVGDVLKAMHKAVVSNPNLNNEKDLRGFIPKKYRGDYL